jgi:hypothetical protein
VPTDPSSDTKPAEKKPSLLGAAKAKETGKSEGDQSPTAPITVKPVDGHPVFDGPAASAFAEIAQARGLSADQAQHVFNDLAPKLFAQMEAQHVTRVEKWADDVRKHPELGGADLEEKLTVARAAIDQFGPELLPLLDSSGYGSRSEVLLAWYRVGRRMMGDRMVAASTPSVEERTLASQMFDKSPELT